MKKQAVIARQYIQNELVLAYELSRRPHFQVNDLPLGLDFFNNQSFPSRFLPVLMFCLYEMLKGDGVEKYLKQCLRCQKVFLSSKRYELQTRCSSCSRLAYRTKEEQADYMRKYRQILKDRKHKRSQTEDEA